jgi:hypothetical protein
MSVWQVVDDLIELLRADASNAPPAGHVSLTRPAASADLPAIVVTAQDVADEAAGVGRLVENRPAGGAPATASRCSGRLALELWAADQAEIDKLSDATFRALATTATTGARLRFLRLAVSGYGPIEHVPLTPDAAVLRMPVVCAFIHEIVVLADADSQSAIRTIRVELGNDVDELMELRAPQTPPDPVLHPPPTP